MKARLLFTLALTLGAVRAHAAEAIAWQPWSDAAFAKAKKENRFVIMDLEAVWCHWCHVMDETTYKDPKVIALMGSRYVPVRVDQDSRPDLANRYEDYGWPATIVFAADGSEIVRRRGYVNPAEMASMLQAIIDDPSPGPSVTSHSGGNEAPAAAPSDSAEADLRKRLLAGYDRPVGSWSLEHRFLDADNTEYCLRAASRGDPEAEAVARDILRLQRQIFDPAWGGVYQYSAEGDWVHPHFEKIMSIQADNLRTYSLAASQWPEWGFQAAAGDIARYLRTFLESPEGSFYTSQDADLVPGEHAGDYFSLDDAGRRARGIPRVDTHRYARENGWVISALCAYAGATGDPASLREAARAAGWVLAHRALAGGGFRHDETDAAGPFLGDTLAMGSAFLALYQATGDAAWVGHAEGAADFIRAHFGLGDGPGFASSDTTRQSFPRPQPEFDESVALARFANLLGHASGRASDHALAESSLRWALSAGRRGPYVGGLLLAIEELRTEPLHVTVVGRRADPVAQAMAAEARRVPTAYRLIEMWDPHEGPPPRGESIFPDLGRAASFLCANGACSSPIADAPALSRRLAKVIAAAGRE
ncbi:MAG TPA: DUF255 domain-containing protein [Opitutaceae bacterium]